MTARRALACLAFLAALATPAATRELGRAPELRILGFSADWRSVILSSSWAVDKAARSGGPQ